MKTQVVVLLSFILFFGQAAAQSVSPLQQVMTTTSLIARPEVFRDLQANIDGELGKVKPGLQIEGMHEAIGSIRDQLLNILDKTSVSCDTQNETTIITIKYRTWEKTLNIPSAADPQRFIMEIKENVQIVLKEKLDSIFNTLSKPKLKTAFADAAASGIMQSELAVGINLDAVANKQGTEKLASAMTEIVFGIMQQRIDKSLSIQGITWKPTILQSFLQQEFGTIISKLHAEVTFAFNQAEHEISRAIDETSKQLLAANTGIGITKGKGSFNGGLYVSVTTKEQYQLGVYVNGELSKSDSTQPNESLVGIHLRYATDAVQLDVLGAGLFGDGRFQAFKIAEAGIGLSTRTRGDMLFGIAAYGIGETIQSAQFTLGISVQSAQVGAPSVFIGLQGNSGNYHPIIQTSFPIVPSSD